MALKIVDVYADNFDRIMEEITDIVEQYPIIGIDTEFPGSFQDFQFVAAASNKLPLSPLVQNYHRFKVNVDNMKLIQLGLSFCNEQGQSPPQAHAYQFNFQFDLETDLYYEKSIEMLRMHKIDFERFKKEGISPIYFSYQFMQAGLLCNPGITWVFFHGSYDMGYLIKQITLQDLPLSQSEFIYIYQKYFPGSIDLKVALKWDSSLASLMSCCGVERKGESHQAGSDALGTVGVFMARGGRQARFWAEARGRLYDISDE